MCIRRLISVRICPLALFSALTTGAQPPSRPMTLMYTLATSRSGVTSRRVTVSRPPVMRGSFIAPMMAMSSRFMSWAMRPWFLVGMIFPFVSVPGGRRQAFRPGAERQAPGCAASVAVFFQLEALADVAFLDVGELLERDAAFEAFGHFLGVVLEALERGDGVLGDDDAVAHQAQLGVA